MLRDNLVVADLVPLLREDDFRTDAHRKLWSAIVSLWDRGRPADARTVADVLHGRGQLQDVGGYGVFAELWEEAATAAHATYHAGRVREASVLRRLEVAGGQIAALARDPSGPAEEALAQAERLVLEISQVGAGGSALPLAEVIREAGERLDAMTAGGRGLGGLPTGFRDLDELTAGLHPSELVVLGARPSTGKTALGLCVARNVCVGEGLPVFFASLEQSRVELALRLMCAEARVDAHRLRRGTLAMDDADRLRDAAARLRRAPLHIDDSPAQGMLRVGANARRLRRRHGIALVVVDYLQLVEPDSRKEPRQEQVAGVSRRLKHLAKELEVPVLALAQVNRGPEDRADRRPRLSDLRESGSIEADADTVLLLHRPDRAEPGAAGGLVEVHVAKQRNGPTGEVALAFRRQWMRFEDHEAGTPFDQLPD